MPYSTSSPRIANSRERRWSLCCNRAMVGTAQSSGSHTEVTYRAKYFSVVTGKISAMRLIYANWWLNATGEENSASTYLMFKCAIETADGYYPVTFGGLRTGICAPGAHLVSDPVGMQLDAGEAFWVRTDIVSNFNFQKWPTYSHASDSTNLGESFATNPRDQVDATGALTNGSAASVVGPVAIQGIVDADDVADCVIIGSSSGMGQGDTAESPYYDWGYLSRFLSVDVGHIKMARATTTLAIWNTNATHQRQMALLAFLRPSHAIVQLGANDWNNGTSYATMLTYLAFIYGQLDGLGIRVIGQTYTPVNGGTFGQAQRDVVRSQVNNWIRTTPSPLWGYLEVTDKVETGRNSGTLAATLTADGTHLTAEAHKMVASLLRKEGALGKFKLTL